MVDMPDRPTLDYTTDPPPTPREPRWRRVVTAVLLTLATLPCLVYAAAGWYAQVFGDADIGGPVVWVICVIALGLAWYTVKHWLAVRE